MTGLTDDTSSDLFQELRKGSAAGGEGRGWRWRPRTVSQGDEGADAGGAAGDSDGEEDGEEDQGGNGDAAMYWMPDALMVCGRVRDGMCVQRTALYLPIALLSTSRTLLCTSPLHLASALSAFLPLAHARRHMHGRRAAAAQVLERECLLPSGARQCTSTLDACLNEPCRLRLIWPPPPNPCPRPASCRCAALMRTLRRHASSVLSATYSISFTVY